MIQITISDVMKECGATLYCGDEHTVLKHFSTDTRTLQEGDVYIGIRGENFDGNTFYLEAFQKGASCCILDSISFSSLPDIYQNRAVLVVDNTVEALQKLAIYKRNQLSIPVVAVTGSAGKTSTKDMIAAVLSQKYHVFKTPGNLNGQIGLPLSILAVEEEEILVLEMGMNDFGQISKLTRMAKPSVGVFTNIGTAHIGILGSKENILKAKLEMLEGMSDNSPILFNGDDELLSSQSFSNHPIYSCSMKKENSDYYLSNISVVQGSSHYDVTYRNQTYSVIVPVMGNAFLMDSLLAIAVGDYFQVSKEGIQQGLSHFQLSGNRMEVLSGQDITILNDTYNSNYEALENALDILTKYVGTRKLAVLGDVLELNDYASKIHYDIGMIPDLKKVDYLFLQGENAKYIKEGALANQIPEDHIFYFEEKDSLEQHLLSFLSKGDVVLLKASHGMHFETIVQKLKESYLV